MSLAIQWGVTKGSPSQGFIYFDAVTEYSTNYGGTVTSHPISSGSNISDHFVRNNTTMSLSAVISGVDISSGTHLISDKPDGSGNKPTNTRSREFKSTSINQKLGWSDFLPDSIGQFFSPNTPSVVMSADQRGQTWRVALNKILELFQDGKMQFVTLYEYDNNLLNNVVENLVLTSLRFYEDPDTGDALFCSLSLEQVTITSTTEVALPEAVAEKYRLQSSPLEKKTPVVSKEIGVTEAEQPVFEQPISTTPFLFPFEPSDSPLPFKNFYDKYRFDVFPSGG